MARKASTKEYLYFDTTCRNPRRIRHLLKVVERFDGQVLTNALCEEMIQELIKFKWFKPDTCLKKLESTDPVYDFAVSYNHQTGIEKKGEYDWLKHWKKEKPFTDEESKKLLNAWRPDHGNAGFRGSKKDPHWASRWFDYFTESKIAGLVYFEAPGKGEDEDKFAKPFHITDLGHRLIKSIPSDDTSHDAYSSESTSVDEQIIYCHIMAKLESCNPMRRVSYDNSPFPLLLKALLVLKDSGEKPYIRKNEMLILVFWKGNKPRDLADYIVLFRKKKIGNKDPKDIEKVLIKDLNLKGSPFTAKASINSSIDAYWRRLKATGIFLRRGNTYTLDLSELKLIKYIIKTYLPVKTSGFSEQQYSKHATTLDKTILSYKQQIKFASSSRLNAIANYLSWDQIKNELLNCHQSGTSSQISEVDGLKASLRYEFFWAVAIVKKFKKTKVTSNCKTDSFGWPISFASGMNGTNTGADIECFEQNLNFIVEPSLATSKSEQTRECLAIDDHLNAFINQQKKDAKSFFVSTLLTARIEKFSEFLEYEKQMPIMKNLTTKEFISKLESESNLEDCFNNAP